MDYEPHHILVTGGAGFIGSHVVKELAKEFPNAALVVVDKLDACASLSNLDFAQIHRFVQHDILDDPAILVNLLNHEDIDTVMHFAAHTHVDNSFGNSLAFTLNNTYGTHALLEACRVYGKIKRFINVSTDEVYGESLVCANEDDTVLDPTNPYAAAKAGAELIAKAYHCSFGIPVITTRGNNVYGPCQYPEKLIPKMIMRGLRGLPLEIHGDGSALRSFLYVTDVAKAFMCVLKKGRVGDTYNIGSSQEKSVLEVAWNLVRQLQGTKIRHVRDRAFNDCRYFICDAKLTALGWTPKVQWTEGIRRTIEWYAEVPEGYWHDVDTPLHAHPT